MATVKFQRRESYREDLLFRKVTPETAVRAFVAHQQGGGNRGPIELVMAKGARASIHVGEFVAVTIVPGWGETINYPA